MARRSTMTKKDTVRGILVMMIVMVILCVVLFIRYQYLKKEYNANAETIAVLEDQTKEEEERTEKLKQQDAYQQTDEFIEETARKFFNLVMPGDTTIKPNEDE